MSFRPAFLWTDILLYILLVLTVIFLFYARKNPLIHDSLRSILKRRIAMFSAIILLGFVLVAFLDSLHFYPALTGTYSGKVIYSSQIKSLFDVLITPMGQRFEHSYTAPFAVSFASNDDLSLTSQALKYFLAGILLSLIIILMIAYLRHRYYRKHGFLNDLTIILYGKTTTAWRSIFFATLVLITLAVMSWGLSQHFHVFGTDKVGQDVYYQTLKSIRTGLIIGSLTTLFMLPFAVLFGTLAGYFSGWLDDIVQYVYTTLSSIPGVLLISAAILSLQIFTRAHPELFASFAQRADARLLMLCVILGVTSWTDLCRLIRGETLKLREIDFVQAAVVMGAPGYKIIIKHIIPNLAHIVLITMVLDFSALVLAEAVLSYVGVGVDPSTFSWGNMINAARFELARQPMVWWPLVAAFVFMFSLVLAANLFADAVRDAFDPRLRGLDVYDQ